VLSLLGWSEQNLRLALRKESERSSETSININRHYWWKLSVYFAVVTKLCFEIVEEINYMFRPFSGWAIIIHT
jgi:hypothetical protein